MPRASLLTVFLVAAFIAGCGSTPPTRHFLLESVVVPPGSATGPRIGISELEVSQYLLAPQLQQRSGPNALERAAFERWGEPMDDAVERVLLLDLAAAAGTESVRLAPWPRDWVPDWELKVRIERLDAGAESATLVAIWSFQDGARGQPANDRITRLSIPRSGDDGAAIAADLSALLGEFARRVSVELPASGASDATPASD
jgi:hypothetical protein